MRRALILALGGALVLTTAPAALAQETGEGGTQQQTVFEMFFWSSDWIGVAVIYLLLAMSVFSIGFLMMLLLQHRRAAIAPPETRQQIESLIAEKKYRDAIEFARSDDSYLGRLTSAALNEANNGFNAMERAIEETGDAETTRYLRPVEYLNVVGNIAPMLGLFGTVYGMIRAFQKLVELGGNPDPTQLAGGISTALVTTLWGLVVAIPALAGYALLRNKIDALTTEGMLEAEQLIATFKSGRKSSSQRPRATPKPDTGDAGPA